MLSACSEDTELPERDVHFCVRAAWQEGRSVSRSRAISDDVLTSGTGDIEYYPETITIKGNDDVVKFTLTKGATQCQTHGGYFYNPSTEITDVSTIGSVKATTEDGEVLTCTVSQGDHVHFALQHTQALLRFAFKVNEKYDKIRFIKITQIKLNGNVCNLVDRVLKHDDLTLIAYAYVDPSIVTTTYKNTLACTYDIYDKDAKFDGSMNDEDLNKHLTRNEVVASNQFTLNSLKDGNNITVTVIKAGYYYDLNITLNPDYLYVLSDHDNKHMTIE